MTIDFTMLKLFRNCPKPSGWFAGKAVLSDGSLVTVKGSTYLRLFNGIRLTARVTGQDGRELSVDSIKLEQTNAAVIGYVAEAIGDRKAATALVNKFGTDIESALKNNKLSVKFIVGEDAMEELTDAFIAAALGDLLGRVSRTDRGVVDMVLRRYGLEALDKIRACPYCLLQDFPCAGFRFADVDRLALEEGMNPLAIVRVDACVEHSLGAVLDRDISLDLSDNENFRKFAMAFKSDLNGNGCVHRINQAQLTAMRVADYLKESATAHVASYDGVRYYAYLADAYRHETEAVDILRTMSVKPPQFVKSTTYLHVLMRSLAGGTGCMLDASQMKAVETALSNRVSVLTGGPGVGKTTTIKAIAYAWEHGVEHGHVKLLAPTWLALKRMRESVHDVISGVYANTVQSFVKSTRDGAMGERDLVIVDETSMVGFIDGCKLLKLCQNATVLFVGDQDQLPSIKPGDFFHDVIEALRPGGMVSSLTVCHRANAKVLKDNADAVNAGLTAGGLQVVPGLFEMQPFMNDRDTADYVSGRYMTYLSTRGLTPADIVVLCPSRKGPAGTYALNTVIRDQVTRLTPASPSQVTSDEEIFTGRGMELQDVRTKRSDNSFRVGDRVIALENVHDLGYTNGDMGEIIAFHKMRSPSKADKSTVTVMLDGKGLPVDVPVDRFRADFDLGYAVTVHKSQGSEWSVVLFVSQEVLLHAPEGFATRPLLYTGMTRGRDTVEITGVPAGIKVCAKTGRRIRPSMLADRYRSGVHVVNISSVP